MLNKAITSACDVKSFSLRLRNSLLKHGVSLEHSKVLEVVSGAFQCKNWNVLSSKLKNVSRQLTDQKTIILHIESSASRVEIDSLLESAVLSSGFCVMPSSVVEEVTGLSYVFDLDKKNCNNFITFLIMMSNSIIESKILVKNMFFKRIVVETETFNDYFSSELERFHEKEIMAAFEKLRNGESVFTEHEDAIKEMNERKRLIRDRVTQCHNK